MSHSFNRQMLLQELQAARRELMRSLKFLNEKEATMLEFRPDWCVRDVISHITAVECTALAAAQHLVEDGNPEFHDPLDEREFNRQAIRRRREFALSEVMDELAGSRRQLFKLLRKVPEDDFYAPFPVGRTGTEKSLADVVAHIVAHDYEHAADIWQWRAATGLLKRERFRDVILLERRHFLDALTGLMEEDMVSIPVCGHWTVRDVMAHILSWDEEAYRTAENWTKERPWQEGALYDDEWNEIEVAKRRHMNVIDLADGLATYHRKWLRLFDQTSNADLVVMSTAPWGERMALISFFYEMASHDAVHTPDLRRLQQRLQRYY
ncbi:MAG: DinB family protein [Caldilineales bacterium]|nr:DinB family protein [Caldilineales bacterium]